MNIRSETLTKKRSRSRKSGMVLLRMASAAVGGRLWKGFAASWGLKGRKSARTIEYISLSTRQRPCFARSDAETRSHAVSREVLVKITGYGMGDGTYIG